MENLNFDFDKGVLIVDGPDGPQELPIYSKAAFEHLSKLWLVLSWNQKYTYTFAWMGRPIIQLPDDLMRIQEVIYRLKPDVIVETGVAHGGSLIYYASLFEAMGHGRVIGVDIEIRPHNREAIEAHELFHRITLIEGDSIAPATVDQIKALIKEGESVLVSLDSNHEKDHVRAELEAYCDLVQVGSYLIASDGIMGDLWDSPRGQAHWRTENPTTAAAEFVAEHSNFIIEQPDWPFNESELTENITHWPGAWVKRIS